MLAQSYTTIYLNTFWRVKKVKRVTNYLSPIVAFIEYMKAIIISIRENNACIGKLLIVVELFGSKDLLCFKHMFALCVLFENI